MNSLTARQQAILDFIRLFVAQRGFPPSRSEIAQHFGWSSTNAVACHLWRLEEKGAIVIDRLVSRGIALVDRRGVVGRLRDVADEIARFDVRSLSPTDRVSLSLEIGIVRCRLAELERELSKEVA